MQWTISLKCSRNTCTYIIFYCKIPKHAPFQQLRYNLYFYFFLLCKILEQIDIVFYQKTCLKLTCCGHHKPFFYINQLGGYRPLLAIACQPPGTAYTVPIRIASQSVLALLARYAMIAEIILPTNSNFVFA